MPFEYWLLSMKSVLLGGPGTAVLPAPWQTADVLATMVLLARFFDGEGDWITNAPAQPENYGLYLTLGGVYGAEGQAMFGDLRWVNDPTALTVVPSSGAKAALQKDFEAPAVE